MTRSPFFYVGDKYKLMSQLKEYFPKDIDILYEPFCGGGSVFLNTDANNYYANDKNEWMIKLHIFLNTFKGNRENFFKLLELEIKKYKLSASYLGINVPNRLKKDHVKTYYAVFNKLGYTKLKMDFNRNKKDLIKLYLLLVYGFNHMLRFNKSGEFNLPVGNVDYNKNVNKALNDYFDFIENNKIVFFNEDFENFIRSNQITSNDFVYLDPPYLITSSEYNKSWGIDEEKRLLSLLDALNEKHIKFALSNVLKYKNKENSLLKEWCKKYNVFKVDSNYICCFDNSVKKDTIEVLITNYEYVKNRI